MSRMNRMDHYLATHKPEKVVRETIQQANIRLRKKFTRQMQQLGYLPGGPGLSIWLFDNGNYRGTVNAESASEARSNIKQLLGIKSTRGFTVTRTGQVMLTTKLEDAHAPQ